MTARRWATSSGNGDTATEWREKYLFPFFDQYLRDGQPRFTPPQALIYNTGENHWDKLANWPLACESGCEAPLKPLYLQANGGLGFEPAASGGDFLCLRSRQAGAASAAPGEFRRWPLGRMLVSDQRGVDGRTDVMTYQTPVLTQPLRVSARRSPMSSPRRRARTATSWSS